MLVNAYQEGRSGRLLEPPGASRTSGNLLTVILASSHPFPTHSGKGRASGGWSLITEVPLPIQEGLLGSSCSTTQWIPASHPPTLLLNTPYQADQLRLPKKKKKLLGNSFLLEVKNEPSHRKYQILHLGWPASSLPSLSHDAACGHG